MALLSATCAHPSLCLNTDEYASRFEYIRPTEQKRLSAEQLQSGGSLKSRTKIHSAVSPSTFPGPLLLPGDDLSTDPKYPAQSLRQWARDKDRNAVTPERNVVYVAAPPKIDDSVKFMGAWARPTVPINPTRVPKDNLAPPATSDVVDYLSAYYYGMKVKTLSQNLTFTSWNSGSTKKKSTNATERFPKHVGLTTSTECIRIRTRSSQDGSFHRQLNLNDLLDGAIEALPDDAYALLLLVDHDLYEDEDDDFACGRAYGGSRVAVVSFARYHPKLDSRADVDVYHAWPASHCKEYIEHTRDIDSEPPTKRKKTQKSSQPSIPISAVTFPSADASPITDALKAHKAISPHGADSKRYEGLWLGRVCKTAAHEVGHCFGMDHCVYYACAMQGTASLAEDARQPPYLCPVDLVKMLNATGADAIQRYQAIQAYCSKHPHIQLFAAFHAWIAGRLKGLACEPSPTI